MRAEGLCNPKFAALLFNLESGGDSWSPEVNRGSVMGCPRWKVLVLSCTRVGWWFHLAFVEMCWIICTWLIRGVFMSWNVLLHRVEVF